MEELMTMLRQGSMDVFVGALSVNRPPEEVETTILLDERLAIICGKQHPLFRKNSWKTEELTDYPWMLSPTGTELRQQADAAFLEMGLTNVNVAIETLSTVTLLPILTRGNYLSLHSKYLLAPDIKSGKLAVLSEDVPASRRSLAAFHRSKSEMTALLLEFVDNLQSYAETS